MIKSKVSDIHDFLIEKIKDQFIVNGHKTDLDIVQLDDLNYHIIYNDKSYMVTITQYDIQNKNF
jgi:hypothetical protein